MAHSGITIYSQKRRSFGLDRHKMMISGKILDKSGEDAAMV